MCSSSHSFVLRDLIKRMTIHCSQVLGMSLLSVVAVLIVILLVTWLPHCVKEIFTHIPGTASEGQQENTDDCSVDWHHSLEIGLWHKALHDWMHLATIHVSFKKTKEIDKPQAHQSLLLWKQSLIVEKSEIFIWQSVLHTWCLVSPVLRLNQSHLLTTHPLPCLLFAVNTQKSWSTLIIRQGIEQPGQKQTMKKEYKVLVLVWTVTTLWRSFHRQLYSRAVYKKTLYWVESKYCTRPYYR